MRVLDCFFKSFKKVLKMEGLEKRVQELEAFASKVVAAGSGIQPPAPTVIVFNPDPEVKPPPTPTPTPTP